MNQTEPIHLVEDSREALQALRRSLIELYESIGANPETPQDVSRQYNINRNLTWKLSRVITAQEPFAALNHLPGQPGLELALEAFSKAGASPEAVGQVRAAMDGLLEVVREHAGDREHLELTLESMGLFERDTSAESGREAAFRGNSSVWGVQAKTRSALTMIAPGVEPETLDYVVVSGMVGIRRLRPNLQWRLYRAQLHNDKGAMLPAGNLLEEIDPKGPGDLPLLVKQFCSPNMPELMVMDGPAGRDLCLPSGQVGNRATFDCFGGYIYRGLSGKKSATDEYGSTANSITMPVELLIFDLIVHRDLPIPQIPEVQLFGFPTGGPEDPSVQTSRNMLPMHEQPMELAGHPPAVATAAVPRLAKLADHLYERMGWKPSEFRGVRVQMRFPPMGTRMVIRWKLP